MSTTVVEKTEKPSPRGTSLTRRLSIEPIGMARLIGVELRKMFNTRSGYWLVMSIGITGLIATAAVIAFAPDDVITYETFGSAIGFPIAFILPIIALLSITSEWSQRSGLTSFTLVPRRGRVITAKAWASLIMAIAAMLLAFPLGAVGNLVGSTINGTSAVWDIGWTHAALIVFGNVLSMSTGFVIGVLLRNSAAGVVGYFVVIVVITPLAELLAAMQQWFADLRPWVDFQLMQQPVFEGTIAGEQWAQLAVSGLLWTALPLAIGLWTLRRSEVK